MYGPLKKEMEILPWQSPKRKVQRQKESAARSVSGGYMNSSCFLIHHQKAELLLNNKYTRKLLKKNLKKGSKKNLRKDYKSGICSILIANIYIVFWLVAGSLDG